MLALCSPIEAYEGQLFSVHMVQHMLLELVAAPLILLGAPMTLTLRVASPDVRRGLLAVLHSRVVAVLTFPLLTWLAFAAVNWGWHFSTLYDQALENEPLHYLQHATFLDRGAAVLVAGGRSRSGADGASPTRSASSTSSWPCRRTRSWAWR